MMGAGMMGEQRMQLLADSSTVAAGSVSFVATNRSPTTHELLLLPLAAGQQVGQRHVDADNTVSETGSLAEASNACGAGSGGGITPGASSWVTIHLTPGRYELVCNLPGHYAAGMYTLLTVS